jgi:hypothetical protein
VDLFLLLLSLLLVVIGAPLLTMSWLHAGPEGVWARWAELVLAGAALLVAGMILAASYDIGSLPSPW